METSEARFSTGGYFCPVCDAKYCELPVECKVCGLTLIMAPHLARSYHHLFPLAAFNEISNQSQMVDGQLKADYEFGKFCLVSFFFILNLFDLIFSGIVQLV